MAGSELEAAVQQLSPFTELAGCEELQGVFVNNDALLHVTNYVLFYTTSMFMKVCFESTVDVCRCHNMPTL